MEILSNKTNRKAYKEKLMKIEIERDQLMAVLECTATTAGSKKFPILDNVRLTVNNGCLIAAGTDGEIEFRTRTTDLNIIEDGETLVPARKILEIVRRLNGKIKISKIQQRVVVCCGKSKYTLATFDVKDFPDSTKSESDIQLTIALDSKEFLKKIMKTLYASGKDDVRYFLNGLWINPVNDKAIELVCTDGHRMSRSELDANVIAADGCENRDFIVPRKAVMKFQDALKRHSGVLKMVVTSNHIKLVGKDQIISSKLIDGRYPDYRRVYPREVTGKIIVEKQDLESAVYRATILSHEKSKSIALTFDSELKLSGQNSSEEESNEILTVNHQSGPTMEGGVNGFYLKETLSAIEDGEIEISYNNQGLAYLVKHQNDKSDWHLLMPVRL